MSSRGSANQLEGTAVMLAVTILGIVAASCVSSPKTADPVSQKPSPAKQDPNADIPSFDLSEWKRPELYPRYPAAAENKGTGGYVIVQFNLPEDGRPTQPVVVAADPKGVFDASCIATVKQLHYTNIPATWVAKNPGRRNEFACVYEVHGSSQPPKLQHFPGMQNVMVSKVKGVRLTP